MARSTSTVAAGTQISGRIEGSEDLEVLGAVKGEIRLDGALHVDEEARVEAECHITRLVVHGILVGDVNASDAVEIHATARVIGDVTTPRIVLHEGALYRGTIDMGDAPEGGGRKAKPAPTRGRVRSSRSSKARKSAAPRAAATPDPVATEAEDEPAPPTGAATKKVAVKKRK